MIAGILGDDAETDRCNIITERMKHAIKEGVMLGGRMPEELMGPYIIAFAFGLVPEELRQEYHDKIVSLIHANNDRLDTGFLATPFLLDVLCDIGELELAHTLLWQNRQPSWMYEVEHGATAIWEEWFADEAERTGKYVSFQHYAFGCVDDWICRRIAGIDSDVPGFGHLIIAPQTDDRLEWCSRSLETEAGTVRVRWDRERLNVTIPCNATATVRWMGSQWEVVSGNWTVDGSGLH